MFTLTRLVAAAVMMAAVPVALAAMKLPETYGIAYVAAMAVLLGVRLAVPEFKFRKLRRTLAIWCVGITAVYVALFPEYRKLEEVTPHLMFLWAVSTWYVLPLKIRLPHGNVQQPEAV